MRTYRPRWWHDPDRVTAVLVCVGGVCFLVATLVIRLWWPRPPLDGGPRPTQVLPAPREEQPPAPRPLRSLLEERSAMV